MRHGWVSGMPTRQPRRTANRQGRLIFHGAKLLRVELINDEQNVPVGSIFNASPSEAMATGTTTSFPAPSSSFPASSSSSPVPVSVPAPTTTSTFFTHSTSSVRASTPTWTSTTSITVSRTSSLPLTASTPPTSSYPAVTVFTFPGTMTGTTYVPVTLTETKILTDSENGQLITLTPGVIFASEALYTTTLGVRDEGGKGVPSSKVNMVVGVSLAAMFIVAMPIVVWLALRYRHRSIRLSNLDGSDKRPPSDAESTPTLNNLDLLEPITPISDPAESSSSAFTEGTRQVWTIVDGEKRQITVPRHPPRPVDPADNQAQFTGPLVSPRHQPLPRLAIPDVTQSNYSRPLSSVAPIDILLSHGNMSTSHTTPDPTHPTQANPGSSTARLIAKVYGPRRRRPIQEASSPEVAARIFVPGRAVDMGPLGRSRAEDVDENGLLPPDYLQATQPLISPQRSPQAGPGTR